LSKNQTIAIQRGQTNTTLMTVGGARIVHSKHKHHHSPLKLYTNTNKPRQITSDALSSLWDRCCQKETPTFPLALLFKRTKSSIWS